MVGVGGSFLALWTVSGAGARLLRFLYVLALIVVFPRVRFCVWASGLALGRLVRLWFEVEVERRM